MNKMRRQSLQTRHQIEIDDPELDKLVIGRVPRFADNTHWPFTNWKNYHPHDGDWERDGEGVGRNTHIKELSFGNGLNNFGGSRVEFEAFCRGFACNKSIERLTVYGSRLFDGEIFAILSPFLENNHNLRCLKVGEEYAEHNGLPPPHPPNSARLLSGTLSRFNTLREFDCSGVFRTGSRQSQSARQSVMLFNSTRMRLDMKRAFVPMEVMSGRVKGAAWLEGAMMVTVSGAKGVCLRWLALSIRITLEWTHPLPMPSILGRHFKAGLTRRGQARHLRLCARHQDL